MMLFQRGDSQSNLSPADLESGLAEALQNLGARKKVLIIPPDITRMHSQAGHLTAAACRILGEAVQDILPAIGTHEPMTSDEMASMFGGVPEDLFRTHNWRSGITSLGTVPADTVHRISGGKVNFPWDAQVSTRVAEGGHDLILSIGQVVPHEVVGMANGNKNILVGTGGSENIHKTHFVGAVCGMESMMGRVDTPVRRLFDHAMQRFGSHLPVVYVQTVIARDDSGQLCVRGLFISDDNSAFQAAAELAQQVNVHFLDRPLQRVVVYLDPEEFRSTWLGNKSIYRTRMAIADGGELTVIAPGVRTFGEDQQIDTLIRKYGYRTTEETLAAVDGNDDLASNLAAAAHLIHGSSENRFKITYCPGHLTREEIENVNYAYGDLAEALSTYPVARLTDGHNTFPDGSEFFYVSNPALGLWSTRSRFN